MNCSRDKPAGERLAWLLAGCALAVFSLTGLCFCAGLTAPKDKRQAALAFFEKDCARCHDMDAEGDGELHSNFLPPPANLTLVRDTVPMFISIVLNGVPGTAMPKISIDKSLIGEIIRYVRSRPPETAIEWEAPWDMEDRMPDMASGVALFITACAGCHGAAGDGKGAWSDDPRIRPKPSNFHAQSSDMGRLFFIISNGRPGTMMGPFKGKIPPHARWALAAYVSGLFDEESPGLIEVPQGKAPKLENPYSRGDGRAVDQGSEAFDLYCANCHNAQAKGGFLAPSLIDRDWMHGKGSDADLFVIIDKGIPGSLMPAHAVLDDRVKWQIIAYLRKRGGLAVEWVGLP